MYFSIQYDEKASTELIYHLKGCWMQYLNLLEKIRNYTLSYKWKDPKQTTTKEAIKTETKLNYHFHEQ